MWGIVPQCGSHFYKTERIFVNLRTRKSPLNFGSHPNAKSWSGPVLL